MNSSQNINKITTGRVAKYVLLPGILPRLRRLAGVVAHFLHIFTITFGAAGLIPRNHPCLLTQNIGQYRFRDIVGLAASNVVFSKKNIPQICMFFAVILGFLTSIIMVALIVIQLGTSVSNAQAQYFNNPDQVAENKDLAYIFLHNVFGETGLQNIWTGNDDQADTRSFMTIVFKEMLSTYSQAMLIIAAFIVIYLIIVTVAESAQTGQPFGQKFNTVWAPIRLAVAIGLLVPVGGGYNSAQLAVFQAAHWGSGLATNVWFNGLSMFTSGKLVSAIPPDYGYKFVRGALMVKLCQKAWNEISTNAVFDYKISVRSTESSSGGVNYKVYKYGTKLHPDFCGEVKIPIADAESTSASYTVTDSNGAPITVSMGAFAQKVQESYVDIGTTLLAPDSGTSIMQNEVDDVVSGMISNMDADIPDILTIETVLTEWIFDLYWQRLGYDIVEDKFFATSEWEDVLAQMDAVAMQAIEDGAGNGWAGAGGFYIRLNQLNADISKAISTRPKITKMPLLFTDHNALPSEPGAEDSLFQSLCDSAVVSWFCTSEREASRKVFRVLNKTNLWFVKNPIEVPGLTDLLKYSTAYEPTLSDSQQSRDKPDGAEYSFSYWLPGYLKDALRDSSNLNPLGQLSKLGNSLVIEGLVSWAGGVVISYWSPTGGNILFTIGSIFMVSGLVLTLILPFMPFVYFSFAVIEWVISIFEAVVGMPLWALSFISIGGDGIFGDKAKAGAMMIFEIMLRPTIIVMALVGTVLLFSASVVFFNHGFAIFSSDVGGSFLYGIVYTFAIYSIGNSVFKLIDEMPNKFMRWVGEAVEGYGGFTKAGLQDLNTYAMVRAIDRLQPTGLEMHMDARNAKDGVKNALAKYRNSSEAAQNATPPQNPNTQNNP